MTAREIVKVGSETQTPSLAWASSSEWGRVNQTADGLTG